MQVQTFPMLYHLQVHCMVNNLEFTTHCTFACTSIWCAVYCLVCFFSFVNICYHICKLHWVHGWLSFSWILSANCKGKCRWKFFDSQTNWKGELVFYVWFSFLSQVWTLKIVMALSVVHCLYIVQKHCPLLSFCRIKMAQYILVSWWILYMYVDYWKYHSEQIIWSNHQMGYKM